MKKFKKDELQVEIFPDRLAMGTKAAEDITEAIKNCLEHKDHCRIMFASAPSQQEVLDALVATDDIDWSSIEGFYLDEYIGLPADHPASFNTFLHENLFDKVPIAKVHEFKTDASEEEACDHYTKLLLAEPIDIVVCGVGENGHLAFNDPPVADFADPKMVKVVQLDEICRMQQVHDGCFPKIEDVPTHALTVTIPAMMRGEKVFCIVPAKTKAKAVHDILNDPITEACPATILRKKEGAKMYLEPDSSSKLDLDSF